MTYVFLSHARSDVDPYFETFYKDFTAELRGRMGLSAEDQLAFRDSEGIPLGVDWRAKIESELLECRTFLAMLSPTYMRRQACAREWAVFEWRQRNSAGVMQPDLLIPLAWIPTPPGDLSATIHKRQSAHASLGKMYARYGLRHVVRREGNGVPGTPHRARRTRHRPRETTRGPGLDHRACAGVGSQTRSLR